MKLICACCGGEAPARKQWFNQDTGYGLCPRCWQRILEKEKNNQGAIQGRAWCLQTYGRPGIHHSIDETPTLWDAILAAKIPYTSHETDLYIPATDQTRKILEEFPLQSGNKEAFQNQVEGGTWYDVPFAYLPAWEAKAARHESTKTATRAYENSNPGIGFDNNCAKCGGKMRDSQHGATDEERAQKAGVQTP